MKWSNPIPHFILAAVLALAPAVVQAQYEVQPDGEHSDIVCWDTGSNEAHSLADVNFAAALSAALGTDGFHSLIITFGQCYGGGQMDDVNREFTGCGRPISVTSGSKYNEPSGSKSTSGGALNDGFLRWGEAYKNVHPGYVGGLNQNPKESDAYTQARAQAVWTEATTQRISQRMFLNDGSLVLGSGASSYHAILFAGNTSSRPDYWNDIVRQYKMLTNSGYPRTNITVFFGPGTAPGNTVEPSDALTINGKGTRSNLVSAISGLTNVMSANEQLYIFISDHGSHDAGGDTINDLAPDTAKTETNTFFFAAPTTNQLAVLYSPHNTSGPYVQLNVGGPNGISSNYTVYLNNYPVNNGTNQLVASGTNYSFSFPVYPSMIYLTASNEVWISNPYPTDPPITVQAFLSYGDVETVVDISTPTLTVERQDPMLKLSFNAETGISYRVEYSDSLVGTWVSLQQITGLGGSTNVYDTIGTSNRFYRVNVLTPPPE